MEHFPPDQHHFFLENPSHEPSVCRICWQKFEQLARHIRAKHSEELCPDEKGDPVLEYKRRFGYNKTASLASPELAERLGKSLKIRNARRVCQGKKSVGARLRFKRRSNKAALGAIEESGISKQLRKRQTGARGYRCRNEASSNPYRPALLGTGSGVGRR